MDMEIDEEKIAKIKNEQLEGLKRKTRRSREEADQLSGRTIMVQLAMGETASPHINPTRGRANFNAVGCNLLVLQQEILEGGQTNIQSPLPLSSDDTSSTR